MSLRYQIIVRVLALSLVIVLVGGVVAIWQARQSVLNEVNASTHLAMQLITLGIADKSLVQAQADVARLSAVKQTRHLRIELKTRDGRFTHFSARPANEQEYDQPPGWFVALVGSELPGFEQQIETGDGEPLTLIIKPQPMDEIDEAWQEAITAFLSSVLLISLMLLVVNWVFNKALKPIAAIVSALREIELGEYRHPLPTFAINEFDRIASAINHMMSELDKAQRENRALTQHSLVIQEEERRILSQELHDEFGQSLTAINVMAVTAGRPNADVPTLMQSIIDICGHLHQVVRHLMQQVQPLMLTELGLKATLEELVNQWGERNPGLSLHIECDDEVDQLDSSVLIQIYRVVQECLTNVVRHAHARSVTVRLSREVRGLHLQVQDDGCGCDLTTIQSGFGLRGMKERIRSLEGDFVIESQKAKGMSINAWVPVT